MIKILDKHISHISFKKGLLLILFSTLTLSVVSEEIIPESYDCVLSTWDSWMPCNNGTATRYRHIITPARENGTCQPLIETRPCPISCQVSSWSTWTPCINKTQSRYRNITRQPINGGTECPILTENRTCPVCTYTNGTRVCPINCEVSQWSRWSECINNTQFRTRLITRNSSNNGTECPSLIQMASCLRPCNVTNWSQWSQCINGTKVRTRNITIYSEVTNCSQPILNEVINCTQNCIVSSWSNWTECQNGFMYTTRQILQYPSNGGLPCPALNNTHKCSNEDNNSGYSTQTILGLSLGLGIPLFICLDILLALIIIKCLKRKKNQTQADQSATTSV